ncbi:MAG: hypothetical protein QOF41_3223 [Methylobacteriaceae bacterium]|nr:hypothetical protein [Methylobacteriaceae bacterium]
MEKFSQAVSVEKISELVRAFTGQNSGRPDDEHPLRPGPWGPIIRAAWDRISVFGPSPEPWKGSISGEARLALSALLARHPEIWDVIGGGRRFGSEVELNPQPLPPRYALLIAMAETVMSRAELIHEVVGAVSGQEEQRGIIIVSGYVDRLVDEFCGNGFRLHPPVPGPGPHWLEQRVTGSDLVVMAAQFERGSRESASNALQESFMRAAGKLAEAGLARL